MMKYEFVDSGIEWIGKIPKHWKVARIKDIVDLKSGENIISEQITEDDEYPVFGGNGLRGYYSKYTHEGNFVLIGRQGALCGNINYAHGKFWASEHAVVATPIKHAEMIWLGEVLRTMNLNQYSNSAAQPGLSVEKIKNLYLPVPAKPEQIAIANYLDKACSDIDRVVEIKRKQIENLQQQLKTQMSELFAKGNHKELEKTDALTLPEIPKHWVLQKMKRVLAEKLKYGATESGDLDNPDDPRYIRITDFDDDGSLRDDTFRSLPPDVAKDYLLSEDDILFARSGATVGKTFIFKNYNGIACFAGYLIKAVTLKYKMLPEFLYYYTKTKMYEEWKNLIFTQATIQNIGADKYQYLPVPVPPIEEQKDILRVTELLIKKIKTVQSKIEKQIETLLAYKKSLIHEVVTGKKQVYGLTKEKQKLQTA
jgi:type I restriction enzyme, S subunit